MVIPFCVCVHAKVREERHVLAKLCEEEEIERKLGRCANTPNYMLVFKLEKPTT